MDRLCFKFLQQQRLATYSTHRRMDPMSFHPPPPPTQDQKLRSLSSTTRLTTWPTHNSAFWSDWGWHPHSPRTHPGNLACCKLGGGLGGCRWGCKKQGSRNPPSPCSWGGDTFKTQIPNSLSPSPLRTGTEGQLRHCWDLSFLILPPALGLHPSFFSWGPAAALEEAGILQIKYEGTCLLPLLGRKRSEF